MFGAKIILDTNVQKKKHQSFHKILIYVREKLMLPNLS